MKKIQSTLIIFIVFPLVFLSGCFDKIPDYQSTLIVNNLPEEKCYVSVFPTNITKETLGDNYKKFKGYIALSNGQSPFNLIWYENISSGNKFVIIEIFKISPEPNTIKINVATFSEKGDAIMDWNDMIDYKP
jgi:hypothetical protein